MSTATAPHTETAADVAARLGSWATPANPGLWVRAIPGAEAGVFACACGFICAAIGADQVRELIHGHPRHAELCPLRQPLVESPSPHRRGFTPRASVMRHDQTRKKREARGPNP